MDGIERFLAMGGYAVYVWPAFAVTAVVMIGLLVTSLRGLRREERVLDALQSERRGERSPGPSAADGTAGERKRA